MATISDNDYAKAVMARLEEFLRTQQYTNVTLKTGDVQIQCHRVLLASASEYFHSMFKSGKKENRSDVVDVIGADAETLTLLVKYMYSSNIDITVDNVQQILEACHQFQLTSLLKLCENFMVQHVSADNSVRFYTFAEQYSLKNLKEAARLNMVKNLPEVTRSVEFCHLTLDGIVDYISDPALRSHPVDSVFEAACTWVRFDAQRESLFHRLVEHIPLHLCTPSYLTRTVATYAPMRRDDCHQYLVEAFQHIVEPEQHTQVSMASLRHGSPLLVLPTQQKPISTAISPHEPPLLNDTPQDTQASLVISPHECPLLIGGNYGNHPDITTTTEIHYLNVQGTVPSWHLLTKLPVKVRRFSAVVLDGRILVTGGALDESGWPSADCWMFDLTTKKWNKMPPLHGDRYGHGSVVHGGCVYVGGGNGNSGYETLLRFEMRNQGTRHWSTAPDMPPQAVDKPWDMYTAQMASCDRYIYAVARDKMALFLYDPVTRIWEKRRERTQGTTGCCAVTLNGSLYVVGGDPSVCMRYDAVLDAWTLLTPPTGKHRHGAATVYQGKIMLAGGSTTSVEEYTPEDDSWSPSAAQLQNELSCHCMVTIDSSFCQ